MGEPKRSRKKGSSRGGKATGSRPAATKSPTSSRKRKSKSPAGGNVGEPGRSAKGSSDLPQAGGGDVRSTSDPAKKPAPVLIALLVVVLTIALVLVVVKVFRYQSDPSPNAAAAERRRNVGETAPNTDGVEATVDLAESLGEHARTLTDSPQIWRKMLSSALAAIDRADALVAAEALELEPELQQRMSSVKSALYADEADRRFLEEADEIRLASAPIDPREGRYRSNGEISRLKAAFQRHYGFEFGDNQQAESAAALVRSRYEAVQQRLLAALDYCLMLAEQTETAAADDAWLLRVLNTADADALRTSVRIAAQNPGNGRLEELAATIEPESQPPGFISALAARLPYQDRIALLLRAQEARPSDFWINMCLAGQFLTSEPPELEAALRYYTAALAVRPRIAEVHVNVGVALFELGELDEAANRFQQALSIEPQHLAAQTMSGRVLLKQDRSAEAEQAFQGVLAIDSRYAPAHRSLALLYLDDQPEKAVEHWREALETNPHDASVLGRLGDALSKSLGRHAEAVSVLRRAEEVTSGFPERLRWKSFSRDHAIVLLHMGDALRMAGEHPAAAKAYQQSIALDDEMAEAHCHLGLTLMEQGEFAEALVHMSRGHELGIQRDDWDHPSAAWVSMIKRWIATVRKHEEIHAGKDPKLSPPDLLSLAAFCFQHKHNYAEATRYFREAFDRNPAYAESRNGDSRFDAACCAALAAAGEDNDAGELTAYERAGLRRQSFDWLSQELKWAEANQDVDRAAAESTLRMMNESPRLASVRDDAALERLSSAESAKWRQLWQNVRAAIRAE